MKRLLMHTMAVMFVLMASIVPTLAQDDPQLQYSLKKVYYSDAKRILDYDFSAGTQAALTCQGCDNVDQIVVPTGPEDTFITGTDKLNFVFNINHTHFTLDTAAKTLTLKGTATPTPGCVSMGCSASGAIEYTDGIFTIDDALPRAAANFFYAVRLQDFKAFSTDKYNAFIYGFQGNNLTQGGDYPQARVTAKWIKGYYCGQLFDGDLVLESQIYTNSSQIWNFSVAGGQGFVVPGASDPTSLIIDLAIEASSDGQLVTFSYRTGGATSSMSKDSGGWTPYATYTNSSGTAFYGYPVNKGLQSLVASDLSYPPDAPATNPLNVGKNVSVTEFDSTTVTEQSLNRDYRVVNFQPIGNKKAISYTCTPGSLTAMRSKFSGLSRKPSELSVAKLKANGQSLPYGTYRTSMTGVASGDWGITASDGTTFINANQTLTAGAEYYFYLFIQDNDAKYDLDTTPGVIEDPAVIGIGVPSLAPAALAAPNMLLLNKED